MRHGARILVIGLGVLGALLLAYTFSYSAAGRAGQRCTEVRVRIQDSSRYGFITPASVRRHLGRTLGPLVELPLDSIDTHRIETALQELAGIHRAEAYTVADGGLHIDVWQRSPLFRIIDQSQRACYIDRTGRAFPLDRSYSAHVIPVTGNLPSPPSNLLQDTSSGERWREFWPQLFDFMTYVDEDRLWAHLICQVHVVDPEHVEIVPRVGRQLIVLGSLARYEYKLNKLWSFYRADLPYGQRDQYSVINLAYSNQVVCEKEERIRP